MEPWYGIPAVSLAKKINANFMLPYGLACIEYQDPSGRSHSTEYAFHVGIKDPSPPAVQSIPTDFKNLKDGEYGVWLDDKPLIDPD